MSFTCPRCLKGMHGMCRTDVCGCSICYERERKLREKRAAATYKEPKAPIQPKLGPPSPRRSAGASHPRAKDPLAEMRRVQQEREDEIRRRNARMGIPPRPDTCPNGHDAASLVVYSVDPVWWRCLGCKVNFEHPVGKKS